jgi:hypothetical protein
MQLFCSSSTPYSKFKLGLFYHQRRPGQLVSRDCSLCNHVEATQWLTGTLFLVVKQLQHGSALSGARGFTWTASMSSWPVRALEM